MKNILVIGAGEIGLAVRNSLKGENKITIWDKNPEKDIDSVNLDEVLPNADFLFLCVPTFAIREVMNSINGKFKNEIFVVILSKGLERESKKFAYEIVSEYFPPLQYGLLCGPMLSEEFGKGLGAAAVFASENNEIYQDFRSLFKENFIQVEYSNDIRSIALASVLKNIYSVALGLAYGLDLSSNLKGLLFTKSLKESLLISKILGAGRGDILGLAGLGDMVATSFSPYSSNRESGLALAQGKNPNFSEGLVALPSLCEIVKESESDLPLLFTLKAIAVGGKNPKETLDNFFHEG